MTSPYTTSFKLIVTQANPCDMALLSHSSSCPPRFAVMSPTMPCLFGSSMCCCTVSCWTCCLNVLWDWAINELEHHCTFTKALSPEILRPVLGTACFNKRPVCYRDMFIPCLSERNGFWTGREGLRGFGRNPETEAGQGESVVASCVGFFGSFRCLGRLSDVRV